MLSTLLQRSFQYCYRTSVRWYKNKCIQRSEKSLASLDSHLLADIGLTRVGDRTVATEDPQHQKHH